MIALDQNEQEPTPNLRLRQRQPTSTLVLATNTSRQAVYLGTQTLASNLYNPSKSMADSHRAADHYRCKKTDI
jgi:hypothetical protein